MKPASEQQEAIQQRAATVFHETYGQIARRTDRLFAFLMPVQWVLGVVFALTVSPRTWAGAISEPHIHLWAALFIGGIIAVGPLCAILLRPGTASTRQIVAAGQILIGVLFIHLTGGRIETHFHVFASLALLAFYRDWRILVTAVVLVYLDHSVRGMLWPQSVYGVQVATPWRALEHGAWVIAEVVFLISACRQSIQEMRSIALRQAEQESLTASLRDEITERKRAEERIREQAALLDHARDAIHLRDMNDRILYWNKASERFYGWSAAEVMGRDARELLYEEPTVYADANRTLLEREEWNGEVEHLNKDGAPLVIESRWSLLRDEGGEPRAKLVINTDISEKKRLASRTLHNQRLESIGILAGGIAHDLNNALTPILMAAQLLRENRLGDEFAENVDAIETSAERAGQLVKQVLTFARGIEGERVDVSMNDVVKDQVKMAKTTFAPTIQIATDLAAGLWTVKGDATQLYQVLMNLTINARDAMKKGGIFTIRTRNRMVDEESTRGRFEAKPGPHVLLSVKDTGDGIDPEVIHKIFDPFFTTKGLAGTGMGLSTVLGIISGHGGFVEVTSQPTKGTRFDIFLPAVTVPKEEPAPARIQENEPTGGAAILLIDDEEPVRTLAGHILTKAGFTVFSAENGREGLAIFNREEKQIPIVVTDMAMPVMDGMATIRALRQRCPEIKIVACSGRFENDNMDQLDVHENIRLLHKPYTAASLISAVTEVQLPAVRDGDTR